MWHVCDYTRGLCAVLMCVCGVVCMGVLYQFVTSLDLGGTMCGYVVLVCCMIVTVCMLQARRLSMRGVATNVVSVLYVCKCLCGCAVAVVSCVLSAHVVRVGW